MAWDITEYNVEIELVEELLGTVPKNREVYTNFIAAKGRQMIEKQSKKGILLTGGTIPTDDQHQPLNGNFPSTEGGSQNITALLEEEVTTVEDLEERGWTGFHEDADGPFLMDYMIKGFISEAARTKKEDGTIKQLQDKVKRYVFVSPRRIRLPKPSRVEDYSAQSDKPMIIKTDKGLVCERPLRAQTAQGPRVTVTRSDVVAAGTVLTFTLKVLGGGGISATLLKTILSYGQFQGLGQWRSGGWGRFDIKKFEKV